MHGPTCDDDVAGLERDAVQVGHVCGVGGLHILWERAKLKRAVKVVLQRLGLEQLLLVTDDDKAAVTLRTPGTAQHGTAVRHGLLAWSTAASVQAVPGHSSEQDAAMPCHAMPGHDRGACRLGCNSAERCDPDHTVRCSAGSGCTVQDACMHACAPPAPLRPGGAPHQVGRHQRAVGLVQLHDARGRAAGHLGVAVGSIQRTLQPARQRITA